jgi:hypothetical protein
VHQGAFDRDAAGELRVEERRGAVVRLDVLAECDPSLCRRAALEAE